MLRLREGDVERGIPVNPKLDRITFDEAARDVVNDYIANAKKSLRVLPSSHRPPPAVLRRRAPTGRHPRQ